jgi:hypothetical protein
VATSDFYGTGKGVGIRSSLRRQRKVIRERAAGARAIYRKVASIHGDYVVNGHALADRNKRCVGQVHRFISSSQCAHSIGIGDREIRYDERTIYHARQ